MVVKQIHREHANEYLEYLFDIGTFGFDYERVELENCSAIDDVLILNIRGYKINNPEFDGFACYPQLEDFELFVKTTIRQEKLYDLLENERD
jgi:hypothetical protein